MFDHGHLQNSLIPDHSLTRVLRTAPVCLPRADHEMLQTHLERCDCATRPAARMLAYVLANKLMNTRPVSGPHRDDVAVGGSRVTFVIDADAPRTAMLTHDADTDADAAPDSTHVPVASLLGATLIGMEVGGRAPLLQEDGAIRRLRVTAVQTPL